MIIIKQKKPLTETGLVISKRLLELNMSKRCLAEAVGANEIYIYKILTGERSGAKYIDEIWKILGLDREAAKPAAN